MSLPSIIRVPQRLEWAPVTQWWEVETPPCPAHDHERLKPEVVAVPPLAAPAATAVSTQTIIYPEAQVSLNKKLKYLCVSDSGIL